MIRRTSVELPAAFFAAFPTACFAAFLAVAAAASPPAITAQTLTLAEAVDATLASHPSLRGADARVDAAAAGVRATRAALFPTLAGSAGLIRFEEPMVVAPLHGFDPTSPPDFDRTLVQGQVGLSYTLFDGGVRGADIRGAEAMQGASVSTRQAAVMGLLQNVVGAYTGVLAARAVLDAADHHVGSLEAERLHADQRLREGTAARVEVLRAEAALQDARAQQATARARLGLAERDMARLMDAPATSLAGTAFGELAPVTQVAGEVARDTGEETTITHPSVESARRRVAAARAALDRERAGRLPSISASAGLQNFGSGAGDYVTEWQAGMRLSWPVFTGGARTAAIRRAEASVRAAEADLREVELSVAAALDAARAALSEATARVRALSASVTQWEEVTRIEVLSLETGAGVQQDYLRAEANLFQARAGHARARFDEILALMGQARAQGRLDRAWIDVALETR